MGLQIIVPNASFSYYADIVSYPVPDGLTSLFFLGGSAAASIINHAPGGVAAVEVGTVGYFDQYAEFTGNGPDNHLQTEDLDDSTNITHIAVRRLPDPLGTAPSGRSIFSHFGSTPAAGMSMMHSFASCSNGAGGSAAPKFIPGVSVGSEPNFAFRAAIISGDSIKAYASIAGVVTEGETGTLARSTDLTHPYRIGGDYHAAAGYQDRALIAMVAKHTVALSLVQLQQVYDFLKYRYARRGLVVL